MPNFAELDVSPAGATGPTPHRRGHFDNRELSTIALLAALHFVVSFAARLFGLALFVFLGPFAVYFDGIGGEAIPSLLLAVTVTLIPRFGTASLAILTVWLLNAIITGTLSLVSAEMVAVSVVAHELILGLLGVTARNLQIVPSRSWRWTVVVRTATAIGLANSAALYIQYFIYWEQLKQFVDMWYVHSVALLTGLGYGAVGAAVGTVWGFQLRRAAP